MASIKDLLKTTGSSIQAPVRWPAGNYIVQIISYDLLPFTWKRSGTHGLAYVPTIRAVASVEMDDDSNPELQKEQTDLLEKFGDWMNKEHQFAFNSKDTNTRMAAVSQINFPLIETDEAHEEAIGILDKHAWRLYMRDGDQEQGFLHDTLGLSFPEGTELDTMLEATINQKFMVSFVYEPNPNDPTRPPNLTIDMVTQA